MVVIILKCERCGFTLYSYAQGRGQDDGQCGPRSFCSSFVSSLASRSENLGLFPKVILLMNSLLNFRLDKNEPGHEKTYLMSYANNKGTDQPAHSRSMISAFVVRCQDRMIPLVYISEISRL